MRKKNRSQRAPMRPFTRTLTVCETGRMEAWNLCQPNPLTPEQQQAVKEFILLRRNDHPQKGEAQVPAYIETCVANTFGARLHFARPRGRSLTKVRPQPDAIVVRAAVQLTATLLKEPAGRRRLRRHELTLTIGKSLLDTRITLISYALPALVQHFAAPTATAPSPNDARMELIRDLGALLKGLRVVGGSRSLTTLLSDMQHPNPAQRPSLQQIAERLAPLDQQRQGVSLGRQVSRRGKLQVFRAVDLSSGLVCQAIVFPPGARVLRAARILEGKNLACAEILSTTGSLPDERRFICAEPPQGVPLRRYLQRTPAVTCKEGLQLVLQMAHIEQTLRDAGLGLRRFAPADFRVVQTAPNVAPTLRVLLSSHLVPLAALQPLPVPTLASAARWLLGQHTLLSSLLSALIARMPQMAPEVLRQELHGLLRVAERVDKLPAQFHGPQPGEPGLLTALDVVGVGGMGWSMLVREPGGELWLLKAPLDASLHPRFEREREMAKRINVPQFRGAGRLPDGTPFYLRDYVPGKSLRDHVHGSGLLPESAVVVLLLRLLDQLATTHRMGVWHCDVSPANVIIDAHPSGGEWRAVLIDPGIARDAATLGRTQAIGATPPPEGAPSEKGDIFGVGACGLYALGLPGPAGAGDDAIPVSAALRALLHRMTAPDPALRDGIAAARKVLLGLRGQRAKAVQLRRLLPWAYAGMTAAAIAAMISVRRPEPRVPELPCVLESDPSALVTPVGPSGQAGTTPYRYSPGARDVLPLKVKLSARGFQDKEVTLDRCNLLVSLSPVQQVASLVPPPRQLEEPSPEDEAHAPTAPPVRRAPSPAQRMTPPASARVAERPRAETPGINNAAREEAKRQEQEGYRRLKANVLDKRADRIYLTALIYAIRSGDPKLVCDFAGHWRGYVRPKSGCASAEARIDPRILQDLVRHVDDVNRVCGKMVLTRDEVLTCLPRSKP